MQAIKEKLKMSLRIAYRKFPIKTIIVDLKNFTLLACAKLLYGNIQIQKKKIVVDNFLGKGYGDNPKYICEALLKKDSNIDIVWVCKDLNSDFPNEIRVVKYGSLKALKEYYSARVWIDNVRNAFKPSKRSAQFYIQTWHGNLGNKRIEGAAEELLSKKYLNAAKHDAKETDLMISGSTFFTNIIRDYFWYNGEVLEIGTPRLDVFFKNEGEITNRIKQIFEINEDVKIALYVPTFRNNNNNDCYDLDYKSIISSLGEKYGCEFIMLIRLHPNMNEKALNIEYGSNVINVSQYADVYELIVASDVIITDYSSISFEAGIINKPVFIYANDLDEYIKERGFLVDIYQQPFPVSISQDELNNTILNFEYAKYKKELEEFNKKLGIKEYGNASDALAEIILSDII